MKCIFTNQALYTVSGEVSDTKLGLVAAVRNIRLLCLILTREKHLATNVFAVNQTWASRCDKHFYVINSEQTHSGSSNVSDATTDRSQLVYTIPAAYRMVYDKYINDFDFVLKAEDDTYVVVENLKYLLWHYNSSEPGYLGYRLNKFVKFGYMSGGAGYVISNCGLRHLIERGYKNVLCKIKKRPDDPESFHDIETSRCLQASDVQVWSSLDIEGRETFHPFPPEKHLFGNLPAYMFSWANNPVRKVNFKIH